VRTEPRRGAEWVQDSEAGIARTRIVIVTKRRRRGVYACAIGARVEGAVKAVVTVGIVQALDAAECGIAELSEGGVRRQTLT
jgi:hypothetical protein